MAKRLSAIEIMAKMKHPKASPSVALKLTNPEEYIKVDYEEFFSALPRVELTRDQRAQFDDLQEEMRYLTITPNYREDKLYVYFILKLQEIMNDSNRA